MADPTAYAINAAPITDGFNAQSGLCSQNGRVALEKTAPPKVQEAFIVDQLTGGSMIQAAATQKVQSCKDPVQVTDVKFKGPGGR